MKTQKKASPGNGKNNKVKNNPKQSGHSGRFAKSLLLTEGLLIVLAVMVLMGIRLWQKSNPASAASAVLKGLPLPESAAGPRWQRPPAAARG